MKILYAGDPAKSEAYLELLQRMLVANSSQITVLTDPEGDFLQNEDNTYTLEVAPGKEIIARGAAAYCGFVVLRRN